MRNTDLFTFLMPPEMRQELEELSQKEERTKASIIRRGIKLILEKENAKK